jgi:hypothetical protein
MLWKQRRPEIIEDIDREVYGRMPANTPKVRWEVSSATSEKNGDVAVVTKKLVGHVDSSAYPQVSVDTQMILTVPTKRYSPSATNAGIRAEPGSAGGPAKAANGGIDRW